MSGWRIEAKANLGALHLDVALEGGRAPVALIGPNGSGKTSVLRIAAGLLQPTAAEVEVGGRTLASDRAGVDVPVEQRNVGYVPQGSGLFPHLRALDNVAFGLSVGGRREPRLRRRRLALETMQALECAHLAERWPHELSGGERQRVAVARSLATRPALLLLDEPLAALDATARRSVRTFLARHLREAGCPSIIVTHEPRDVLAFDAEVVALEAGRVIQRGDFDALAMAPASDFIAAFIESAQAPVGPGAAPESAPPST